MPSGLNREQILKHVSWKARTRRFDRIVALDEFDLATAAEIREHMRIPGMGITTAANYRTNWPCGLRLEMPDFWFRSFAGC